MQSGEKKQAVYVPNQAMILNSRTSVCNANTESAVVAAVMTTLARGFANYPGSLD